jgi:hypothetical protein
LTFGIVEHWEVLERDAKIAQLTRDLAAAHKAEEAALLDRAAASQKNATLEENITRLTAERDAARKSKIPPGAAAATATPDAAAAAPADGQGTNPFAKMFESEEGRKMMKSQVAMMTKMQYGDLARTLKLSPQDSDQVMALLSERAAAMADQQFKMMGDGKFDTAAVKEMSDKAAAIKKDYDDKLKAIVGPEKFNQMQEYDRTLGDRMMMAQYEQQFSASGVPLQGTQRDDLLQIMAAERKKSPPAPFDTTGQNPGKGIEALQDDAAIDRYLQGEADYQRRVLDAATKTLNPDQVNALQQAFTQFGEMQKFGIKMSKEMFKPKGAAPAAPAPPAPVEASR